MFTRRKFIGTTLGAGAALAMGACATQPAGKRMIVDSQTHLWKASSPDYPWNPGVKPQLPEPFTIERVLPLMDEAGVNRVVIVPPGLNDVNSYALEAARRYPGRFAVMGRIPPLWPSGPWAECNQKTAGQESERQKRFTVKGAKESS